MPMFYIDAVARYQVDAVRSVQHLTKFLQAKYSDMLASQSFSDRWARLEEEQKVRHTNIALQAQPLADGRISSAYLMSQLRRACPVDTVWAVEAVTNAVVASNQIQPVRPGSWINCGGGGLGWSGGGTLGIKLALDS